MGRGLLVAVSAAIAGIACGLGLAGPAGGSRTGLSPTERQALRIVSVQAAGEEPAGLNVTVTFGGNLQKAIGRGGLRNAAVVVLLEPSSPGLTEAAVLTQGAGAVGETLRRTSSTQVGVVRAGRVFEFFIHGPGVSHVGQVVVKTFAVKPTAKRRSLNAADELSPPETIAIPDLIALDRAVASAKDTLDLATSLADETPCAELAALRDQVAEAEKSTRLALEELGPLHSALEQEIEQLRLHPLPTKARVRMLWKLFSLHVSPFLDASGTPPKDNAALIEVLQRYLKEVDALKGRAEFLLGAEDAFLADVGDRLRACTSNFPIQGGFDHKTPGSPPSEFPSTVCADFGPGGSLQEGQHWTATLADENGNELKTAEGTITSAGTGRVVFGIPRAGTSYTISVFVPGALADTASVRIPVPVPGPPPDDRSKDCSAPPPPA